MSMPVIPIRSGFTFCGRLSGFGLVSGLPGLFSDILSSFLYNASYGRLKRVPKRNYIHLDIDISESDVSIDVIEDGVSESIDLKKFGVNENYSLPLLDFSTPELLSKRAEKTKNKEKKYQLMKTALQKQILITHAHYHVKERI